MGCRHLGWWTQKSWITRLPKLSKLVEIVQSSQWRVNPVLLLEDDAASSSIQRNVWPTQCPLSYTVTWPIKVKAQRNSFRDMLGGTLSPRDCMVHPESVRKTGFWECWTQVGTSYDAALTLWQTPLRVVHTAKMDSRSMKRMMAHTKWSRNSRGPVPDNGTRG